MPDSYGSVITGSSNFSQAGLTDNLEFNVELRDYADVRFALDRFEALWAEAGDIRDIYIETVEKKTWLRRDITPYELYLKTLYEAGGIQRRIYFRCGRPGQDLYLCHACQYLQPQYL